ncbi:MAG: fumarate reductase/succinate dehydrogenase flavoprotein domain-containing protein, partial [uncultured Solirubrobacteraceae bacterium]
GGDDGGGARLGGARGGRLGRSAVRRRGGRRRGRRRGERPARGAVLALAGQRGPAAGEGAGPRGHGQQGGVLVLGAEQRADAGHGHGRSRGGLPALLRPPGGARALRPREPDAGPGGLGARVHPGDLRERVAGGGAARRARRAALPPLRGRAGLLGRAARGQGADGPRPRPARRARVHVRRRAERRAHDAGRRRARRRGPPHGLPGAAGAAVGRRRGRRGGHHRGRRGPAGARAQGGDLRLGRVHARRRAAPQPPRLARLRRLRGGHERGRLRPHRDVARGPAAQHELRVDVSHPAREGARGRPRDVRDVLRGRRLDAVRRQARPARGEREAPLQRAGADVLRVGRDRGRVPQARARPGLGPAQPGPLGQRRVRPPHRAAGHGRRPRHPRGHARGARRGGGRAAGAVRRGHGRPARERGLHGQPEGVHRPLQRAGGPRRGRGLRPRGARRPAAVQRRREGRARPREPDDVAARGGGPVLRRARHGRDARHEGRPEDDAGRARAGRHGRAHPRALRRGQLRRVGLAQGVLGRRRDDRADDRARPPGRERGPCRAGQGTAAPGVPGL